MLSGSREESKRTGTVSNISSARNTPCVLRERKREVPLRVLEIKLSSGSKLVEVYVVHLRS